MSISGIGSQSSLIVQSLIRMRQQLDDLQRQLGTGQKSDTYAGLGLGRGFAVSLRAQLAAMTSYDSTINIVGTRVTIAQSSLTAIDSSKHTVKTSVLNSQYSIDATGQTTDQKTDAGQLDQVLGVLNTRVGDRYIFSGAAPDQPAVESMDHILNGDGTHDGLKTVIAQRNAADLGADGLGRLVISAPSTTSVAVAEDVAGSPFGFKLVGVNSALTGATVSGPAGSPPAATIDFGASIPNAGDTITYTFRLPDGTTENLTMTATTSATPGANEFTIGATPDATAANLQSALTTSIGTLAQTSLSAASAIAAGNDFFNVDAANPPQRVAGPPYDTATSLVDGSSNTVMWYTGEASSTPARATATAQIDPSIAVSYGMRANEPALTSAVANMAVFAAMSFSPSDPNAADRYAALTQRIGVNLDDQSGQQKISDIQAEIAAAQTSMQSATDRHHQTSNTLTDMLQQIEGVSEEQVGAEILALQTQLQASLQTTAKLYQTSLVNYLPL